MEIFAKGLWTYIPERRFFTLKYHKTHFCDLECLTRKHGKMNYFGPKPWSQKSQVFDFFNLLFLYPRKPVFCFKIPENRFFWPRLPKNKMEKWPILDQNHGLTPLKKSQFFYFFNSLFLYPRKTIFSFRIS